MKRNLFALCCVAALACAGTASADILAEDSAANYTPETFVDGANLGSGFGAWEFWNAWPTLADSSTGECGNLNSGNGLSFRFARDGGADYCNGYRGFNALKPGDVLSFKFTCAWCAGGRGLDLFANGGHGDADKVANVINLSGDNLFSVNGTVIASNYAPHAVTEVTITQEADGIQLALLRTSTDEGIDDLEYSTKVETSAKLTGIGLYAGGWDWNDGASVENFAFYVNDLKIEGTPPTDTLSLDGPWAVTEKKAELAFKVIRQNSEGTLDVTLASSYPEFASVPTTVTFADGETEIPFIVSATLQGNANAATISANAEGVAGATYGIKGPQYSCNSWDEGIEGDDVWQIYPDDTRTFWVNNENTQEGFPGDDALVTVESADESVVTVGGLGEWKVGDNGKSYNSCTVTGVAGGKAAVKVLYDGVEMTSFDFTVRADSLSLAGPDTARVGDENVKYTLTGVFSGGSGSAVLSVIGDATVTLEEGQAPTNSIVFGELISDTPVEFFVSFGTDTAPVTLSVSNDGGLEDSLEITVTEAPDYSGFIAYDDASLYRDDFDSAALGEGTDKFQAWEVVTQNSGAVFLSGSAPDASVLTEGKAFGIWANGTDDAELQLRRPFVKSLGDGQAFSVVVSPNYRDGTKGVKFLGAWEGNWYERAEFFYNNDGYFYKLDGDADATSLGWEYGTDAIAITLKKAADGSSYTLSFARGDDIVAKEGINSFQGTVDGVQFYSYKGGEGDENNFIFNSLAIEQVEEPVATRLSLKGDWAVTAASAELAIKVVRTTSEGTLDVTLATSDGDFASVPTTVTFADGETEIPVPVNATLKGNGNSATITASAEGYVSAKMTIKGPDYSCTAWNEGVSEPWKVAVGGERTFWVNNANTQEDFPGDNALVTVASTDESIVKVGPLAEWQVGEDGKAYTSCQVTGVAEGSAAVKVYYDGVEMTDYGFTVQMGGEPIPVTAISIKDGEMTLSLAAKGSQVYSATKVVPETREWNWAPMDIAIIGDGTSVTVPMDAPFMIFKVE